jgi:hypothetical protein
MSKGMDRKNTQQEEAGQDTVGKESGETGKEGWQPFQA